jgi:hypothetical protein
MENWLVIILISAVVMFLSCALIFGFGIHVASTATLKKLLLVLFLLSAVNFAVAATMSLKLTYDFYWVKQKKAISDALKDQPWQTDCQVYKQPEGLLVVQCPNAPK